MLQCLSGRLLKDCIRIIFILTLMMMLTILTLMKSSIFGAAAICEVGEGPAGSTWASQLFCCLWHRSLLQLVSAPSWHPAPSGFTSQTSTSGSALPSKADQTFPASWQQKHRRWLFKRYCPQWTDHHRQLEGEQKTTFEAGSCAETKGSFGGVSPVNPTNQAPGCRKWAGLRRRKLPIIWAVSFKIKMIKRLFLQSM